MAREWMRQGQRAKIYKDSLSKRVFFGYVLHTPRGEYEILNWRYGETLYVDTWHEVWDYLTQTVGWDALLVDGAREVGGVVDALFA